jgi:hypothetical protein
MDFGPYRREVSAQWIGEQVRQRWSSERNSFDRYNHVRIAPDQPASGGRLAPHSRRRAFDLHCLRALRRRDRDRELDTSQCPVAVDDNLGDLEGRFERVGLPLPCGEEFLLAEWRPSENDEQHVVIQYRRQRLRVAFLRGDEPL